VIGWDDAIEHRADDGIAAGLGVEGVDHGRDHGFIELGRRFPADALVARAGGGTGIVGGHWASRME
jgi:hypothetical protein